MVLWSLKAMELQKKINANQSETITNLHLVLQLEREASAQWRAQVDAERKKADAEKKEKAIGYVLIGGGGILIGSVIGVILMAIANK